MIHLFDSKRRSCPITLALLLVCVWQIAAQTQSQLSGTVLDSTGAIVVGASVTVRDVNTGIARTTETNRSGIYTFPLLQSGFYELTCETQGFKKFEQRGLVME